MTKRDRKSIGYHALADLRFEIRNFLNFSEQAARAAGVEAQQHQALLAIKGLPRDRDATVTVLADRLQIKHNSAVELSDRLEANGLIHRSRSLKDSRKVLLKLTRRGERVMQQLSRSHRAELKSAGPKLLRALRTAIRQHAGDRVGRVKRASADL